MSSVDVIRSRFEAVTGRDRAAKLRTEHLGSADLELSAHLKRVNEAAAEEDRYSEEMHAALYQLLGGEGVPRDYFDFAVAVQMMDTLEMWPTGKRPKAAG